MGHEDQADQKHGDQRERQGNRQHCRKLNSQLGDRSLHQLHDEEARAVLFTDVVERTDVRVVEAAGGTGLALEAFTALGVIGQMLG